MYNLSKINWYQTCKCPFERETNETACAGGNGICNIIHGPGKETYKESYKESVTSFYIYTM